MDTSTIEPPSILVCFPLVHDSWLQLLQLFHGCYTVSPVHSSWIRVIRDPVPSCRAELPLDAP